MATEDANVTPASSKVVNDEVKRIDIAPDGDLIFLVQKQVELRVHSFVMSMSSPVFKAMLGPHFAEGQRGATATSPKQVPLPEDEPEAMRLLCLIFYNQGDQLLEVPSSNHVLQLVKAADKYQCLNRVRLTVEAWLHMIRWVVFRKVSSGALLHVVYLLDDAKKFGDYTKEAVADGAGYIDKWEPTDDPLTSKLQTLVRDKAQWLETKVKPVLLDAIEDLCAAAKEQSHYRGNLPGINPPTVFAESDSESESDDDEPDFEFAADGSIPPKCDYIQRFLWLHLNRLAKASLWPAKNQCPRLEGFMRDVSYFKTDRDPSIRPCKTIIDSCKEDEKYERNFRWAMQNLKHETYRLLDHFRICLDCYKAGGSFEDRCRDRTHRY